MTTNSGKQAAPTERRGVYRVRLVALGFWALASLLFATAGASTTGCGGDDCDSAVSKLTGECAFGSGVAYPGVGEVVECKDVTACNAQCVLNTSCQDIVSTKTTVYAKCLAACAKKYAAK